MLERLKNLLSLLHIDYGKQLEDYISRRYPQDSADIERLTREFNHKLNSWNQL
jgi:hypothetical protein